MSALAPLPELPPMPDRRQLWRTPVELVLAASQPATLGMIMKRIATPGLGPYPDAYVFEEGGRFFGIVDFFGDERLQQVFPLSAYRIVDRKPAPPFGRRPPLPFGLQEPQR